MFCTQADLAVGSAHPRIMSQRFLALALVTIALAVGCTESPGSPETGSSGNGNGNGADANGGDEASPLFAVNYTTILPDSLSSGYVNLTESLEGTLDVRDAVVEASGVSIMYASPDIPGAFFIGSGEAPTITRYELSSDDTPIKVETISFARFGLSRAPRFPGLAPIVSADKAYVVDLTRSQLVEWNPTEMIVGDAIDLGDLVREGLAPFDPFAVLVDDGTIYIPVSWVDFTTQLWLPQSALIAVDTETQEVFIHEDDRVSGIRGVYRTASGEVYVSSNGSNTAILNRLGGEELATAPGLLRVLDGERGYDPDFYVPLNDLAGGRTSSDVLPLPDGRIIFSVLQEEEAEPIADTISPAELCQLDAWRYYTIDLAETAGPGATATEVTAWPPKNCLSSFIEFEERLFFVDQREDSGALVDFSNPDQPLAALTVPAAGVFFRSVARMR